MNSAELQCDTTFIYSSYIIIDPGKSSASANAHTFVLLVSQALNHLLGLQCSFENQLISMQGIYGFGVNL